jgi:hypothetical protein
MVLLGRQNLVAPVQLSMMLSTVIMKMHFTHLAQAELYSDQ